MPSPARKSVSFSAASAADKTSRRPRSSQQPSAPRGSSGRTSSSSSSRSGSRTRGGRGAVAASADVPECAGCAQLRAEAAAAAAREAALRDSNSRLQAEVSRLAAEVNHLLDWQSAIREKVLVNCPEAALVGGPDSPDWPLDCLIQAALHPPPAEARLVDLETRVTQLTAEFSQCAGRCLLYEATLEDLLVNRFSVERTHEAIADAFLATGKSIRDAYDKESPRGTRPLSTLAENAQLTVMENREPSALLDEFERKISLGPLAAYPDRSNVLTLKPPAHRLPGSTPIGQMNRDLRQWICADLNLERRGGNDWRILASRLGFGDSVPAWSRLASPMAKLMSEWGRSETATVRQLHRHLSSPEMRSPLLAKRLQEFYRVD